VREGMRTQLRAAARGLPRLGDLLALPRQRFDAVERRLHRALHANSRAHAMRLARASSRLQARLLVVRCQRARDRLDALGRRGEGSLARLLAPRRARLERVAGRINRRAVGERIRLCEERLSALQRRLHRALLGGIAARRRHLEASAKLLASLGYHGVLRRGYALLRDGVGRTLRSVAEARPGKRLEVELADGRFAAQVLGGAADAARPAVRRTRGRSGGDGGAQGSLF